MKYSYVSHLYCPNTGAGIKYPNTVHVEIPRLRKDEKIRHRNITLN